MPQATHRHKTGGFTLIELLVTTAITAIILLTASTMLMTFFLSNTRTTIRRQIKAEGNRAMSRIEFVARGAKDCVQNGTMVTLTPLEGSDVTFNVVGTNIQMNGSENLLSDFSAGTGTTIACLNESGKQYVRVNLILTNTSAAISETFTSFTVLRNS